PPTSRAGRARGGARSIRSPDRSSRPPASETRQGGAEARLRIDQEVGRGDDLLALGEAVEHLVVALRGAPELDQSRREASRPAHDEDDLPRPRVEHGGGGNRKAFAEPDLPGSV